MSIFLPEKNLFSLLCLWRKLLLQSYCYYIFTLKKKKKFIMVILTHKAEGRKGQAEGRKGHQRKLLYYTKFEQLYLWSCSPLTGNCFNKQCAPSLNLFIEIFLLTKHSHLVLQSSHILIWRIIANVVIVAVWLYVCIFSRK